jgi:hypothetical protein
MRRKSLLVTCLVGSSLLGALGPSPAVASPSLVLATAPDPAESITTQVIAKGTSEDNQTVLSISVKPTGGQACAPNASADSGTRPFERPDVEEAAFSKSFNYEFANAGSYLLCAWLNDNAQPDSPVVATSSLTVAVRPPHLSLSVSAPPAVQTGQTFQLVMTAQAEVARNVSVFVLPNTGRGCPANVAAAGSTAGESIVDFPAHGFSSGWLVNGGPFSEQVNETLNSPGQYLVCGYVQYQSTQSVPEITASTAITAIAPPPPCVAPSYSSTVTKLKAAEQAIRISGCAVGKIRHLASRKVRAGYIIGFSAAAGTHLPSGAAINVSVSTGPPCIVPRVSPGTALSLAERRLLANHCSVGKLSTTRSRHYRHGHVLRLGARTGQVLASHAPIAIVVAARRH